jgi:hypothetical protein
MFRIYCIIVSICALILNSGVALAECYPSASVASGAQDAPCVNVPAYIDTSGKSQVISNANRFPIMQPLQQDLISNANNYQPTRSYGFVAGRNNAVNNVRCDLWEGPTCVYVFPVAAQQMAVSSSSASDTSNGTGAQQVHIHYLDGNYAEQIEVVTLNGTTPVNTIATNILRINAFHLWRAGSSGTSAGNISIKNIAATVTYDYITATFNM